MQLKIEQEALKKETDAASKDRLKKLGAELAELQEKSEFADRALARERRTRSALRRS